MQKNETEKLRSVLIEVLDEFVHICEENNLTYFLTAGTLLGAVRHKGFIPWDDDIDVAMPRKDYELFLDLFDKTERKDLYLLSQRKQTNKIIFFKRFAKLCKAGTVYAEKNKDNCSGIFIDIFPFDNTLLFLAPFQTKVIRFFWNLYHTKANFIEPKKKWKYIAKSILFFFLPEKLLSKISKKLFVIFNKHQTKYISFFSGKYGSKKETHSRDNIFPLSKVLFEEKYYFAPCNCHSFLHTLYGNYMQIPSFANRHTHHEYIIFEE